jgi:hypothetical protein
MSNIQSKVQQTSTILQKKDKTMRNETILMLSIFQHANPLGPIAVTPEEFLDHFEFEIDRMGLVLKCLGLAQTAAQSDDFVWKPAPMLIKIIAERAARPFVENKPVLVTDHDQNFVHSLMMRATGDVPEEDSMDATEFCCSVLVALGLMKKGAGGYKPTRRLRDLMLLASLQQPVEATRV